MSNTNLLLTKSLDTYFSVLKYGFLVFVGFLLIYSGYLVFQNAPLSKGERIALCILLILAGLFALIVGIVMLVGLFI